MTTPSETRAGKLPDDEERCESGDPECGPVEFHDSEGVPLCRVCWEGLLLDSAAEGDELPWTPERIQAIANRVRTNGDEEAAHLIELLNTAGIEAEEEALAASEPGEAVGVVDGTEGGCKYVRPLFSSEHMPPVGTKLYTHPAPEQPGKGEAQSIEDDVMFGWRLAQSGVCKKDAHMAAASYARKRNPQPSDPAEGDAVRKALIAVRDRFFPADQPERLRDLLWDEVNTALSTPPTAAVRIDAADLLFVGFDKNSEHRLFRMRETAERHCIGEIKTYAALDPQVKR